MTELVVAALVGAAGAVLAALVDRSNRRADRCRRFDLTPTIGVAAVAVALLLVGKIDGIMFAALIVIGACGTVGASYRMRQGRDSDPHGQ